MNSNKVERNTSPMKNVVEMYSDHAKGSAEKDGFIIKECRVGPVEGFEMDALSLEGVKG